MLKMFRENLKSLSWVLWAVILVFVLLVFAEVGVFDPSAESGRNARAAWADDGVEVRYHEYEREYRNLEERQRQVSGDLTPEMTSQIRRMALQRSLDREILLLEARNLGLSVSDAELRETLLGIPGFTDASGRYVGDEQYQRMVRAMRYASPDEFEHAVREDLLIGKLVDAMRSAVYVSPNEVEELYRQRVETAKVRYLRLRDAQFAGEVTVGPEDLQAYYEANQEDFRLPEQRSVDYLLVDKVQLRDQVEIPQEDIQAYYDENADSYRIEEQVRVRQVLLLTEERSAEEAEAALAEARRRIEGGEDFAVVARDLSEDPSSRQSGGDLGFITRGRTVPEFENAAFGAEPGELVTVQSPIGYHLLEVTDRREGGMRPLEEVAPQISVRLQSERIDEVAEQRAGELVARLKDLGQPTEEALQAVADELDYVTFNQSQPFSRQGAIPGVGRSAEFAATAFALETGTLSDPVEIPRGWAVMMLDEVFEPRLQELSEVEAQINQRVRIERQHELAEQRAEQAKQRLAAGADFESVAAELGGEVRESESFNAVGTLRELGAAGAAVVAAALDMDEGAVGGPVEVPQGVVVYQVVERTRMDPAELETQRASLVEQLAQEKFQRLLTAVLAKRQLELNAEYSRALQDEAQPAELGG